MFNKFLQSAIKDVFSKHFPNGYCRISLGTILPDENHFYIKFGVIGNADLLPNQIRENDPAYSMFSVELYEDKVKITCMSGGCYMIKSANPMYAMESVKLGWRNKTTSPDKVAPYFDSFLSRAKEIMKANVDKSYGSEEQIKICKEHLGLS